MSSGKYPKPKEVDDVLGGSAAWENVDSTNGLFFLNYIAIQIITDFYLLSRDLS
jgi:hypothetical protein